jgi:hypothetical protein
VRRRYSSVVVAIGVGLGGMLTAAPSTLAATTCTFEAPDLLRVEMGAPDDSSSVDVRTGEIRVRDEAQNTEIAIGGPTGNTPLRSRSDENELGEKA